MEPLELPGIAPAAVNKRGVPFAEWKSSPLASLIENGYLKREPRSCWNRRRGWHGAVCAPVHGYHLGLFFEPRLTFLVSRGYLLPGFRGQKQDHSHCREQYE